MAKQSPKTSASPKNIKRALVEYHELRQRLKAIDAKMHIAKGRDKHPESYRRFHDKHPRLSTVTESVKELQDGRKLIKKGLSNLMARMFWIGAELKHGRPLAGVPRGDNCCDEIMFHPFRDGKSA